MSILQTISNWLRGPKRPTDPPPEPIPIQPPTISPIARRIALVEELRDRLATECHEYGNAAATKSGRRTADQAVLKALEALAESKAREMAEAISQSALTNLLRRLTEEETTLEQRVRDRDAAANKLYAAQQLYAATSEPGAYPQMSSFTVSAITLWLTTSLSPSCHDLASGLDPQMRWLVGIGAAFGISVAVVYGILPDPQPDLGAPVNGSRQRGTVIAGVLLGLAFLGQRLSGARTYSDMMLAVGLAVMELGAVVLVERRASALFSEIEAWRERANARRLAQERINVEADQFRWRQQLVEESEAKIAEIEDGLERAHAVGDTKNLITIAVNAMRAGYARGIAENGAALGGAA